MADLRACLRSGKRDGGNKQPFPPSDFAHRLTRVEQSGATGGNAVAEKRIDFAYTAAGEWNTITRYADLAGLQLVAVSSYVYDTLSRLAEYDAVTDTTMIANHISYNAFGGITAETNAAVDHLFGYTGREWDAEADLQYNRARWYDPAAGRWISEDPIGFEAGDENLYRYVGNKPTSTTDPSGLWEWDDDWIELGFFGLIGYHGDDVSTAAGVSIINNPARTALDRLSIVDPTPLSGGTSAVLSGVIEGQSATEIGGNVLLEALPGPSPKKGKKVAGAVDDLSGKVGRVESKVIVEATSRVRAQEYLRRNLRNSSDDTRFDYIDDFRRTYDQIGNPAMIPHWEKVSKRFFEQLESHIDKADFTIVDLTDFPPHIKAEITEYILNLPEHRFDKIIPIGF